MCTKNIPSIEEVSRIANKHGLPFVVDAAAEEDLNRFINDEIDIVIFSGSKAIEAPTSGVVVGKKRYIDYISMQKAGIGHAMKIGKENVIAFAVALEEYLEEGTESELSIKARLTPFIENLNRIKHISAKEVKDSSGREIYRVQVKFNDENLSMIDFVEKLKKTEPAIFTRDYRKNEGIIELDIRSINSEDMKIILNTFQRLLEVE